jgi:DNA-binding GntR family transcriptional regulator
MAAPRRKPIRIARVRKHSRTAYEQVRELIIRGRLAPGARLVEMDLADRFQISRTPVREAIRRLVQEGFAAPVRESLRTQVIVAPLTESDLGDLYTVMGALESAVGRHVIDLQARTRQELAADLARANRRFEKLGRRDAPDFDQLFEAHNAFHRLFVERCGTRRLRALIEQIRPQIDRYEFIYAPLVGPNYEESFAEHRAIVRAFKDGHPTAVENSVRANWVNGAARLAQAVRRLRPLGDCSTASTA